MTEYELVGTAPTVEEYLRLRLESGLSPKSAAQARSAIAGTWSWRRVVDRAGTTVAMGRLLGDGGWYFHVADMATLPAHQRRGLGRRILIALIDDIQDRAPEPGAAYITLLADPPGQTLYRALGFVPTEPTIGMRLSEISLPSQQD